MPDHSNCYNALSRVFDIPADSMLKTLGTVMRHIITYDWLENICENISRNALEDQKINAKKLISYLRLLNSTKGRDYNAFSKLVDQFHSQPINDFIQQCTLIFGAFTTYGTIAETYLEVADQMQENGEIDEGEYLFRCNIARDLFKIRQKYEVL